ncbi:MAG: histidine phosphatase family protein [Pleomorphochaeta sp.]
MKIYITRHGQTDFNKENKVCGLSDIDLNEKGKEQALYLRDNIIKNELTFDTIYVSPLKRAKQTAQPIEQYLNKKAKVDYRLKEFNFGDKEACAVDDVDFRKKRSDPFIHFPNGESMLLAAARVYSFLDELINKSNINETILIVSHKTTSKLINSYFKSQTIDEFNTFQMENCELLEYTI